MGATQWKNRKTQNNDWWLPILKKKKKRYSYNYIQYWFPFQTAKLKYNNNCVNNNASHQWRSEMMVKKARSTGSIVEQKSRQCFQLNLLQSWIEASPQTREDQWKSQWCPENIHLKTFIKLLYHSTCTNMSMILHLLSLKTCAQLFTK